MATVKFEVLQKKENAQIHLRLSVKRGMSFRRKTGKYINYQNWSDNTKLPKQTNADNKNLTIGLQNLSAFVLKRVNEVTSKGETITGDWLEHAIDVFFERVTETGQSELLINAIQDIIDNAKVRKNAKGGLGLSRSRIYSYKSLKKKITEFQGKNIIKVKDVNVKFANSFLKHLLIEKGYQKSTALILISDLKTVCYDAEINGTEVNKQINNIEATKTNNKNIIFLSTDELEKIENTTLTSEALQNARKWLLFGCNIGQRVGDLLMINESNFVTEDGLEVVRLVQQKTNKKVKIPVHEKIKAILETGLPYKISVHKFNTYIKEICKLAGINEMIHGGKIIVTEKGKGRTQKRKIDGIYPKHELLSSHVCRRSFASNLYGVLPTALIMSITQHSQEKMLLNYIGKDSSDYAQQIADFYTLQAQKEKKESNLTVVKNASNQN